MIENSSAEENNSANVMIVCQVCGNTISKLDYDKHLRTHTKKGFDVCQLCFKTFTNHSNYKYHMAHHSNERPWLCNDCPKNYKTKIDLLQHQRVHEKTRDPIHCETCGQYFQTQSNYNNHQRSHRSRKKSDKCNICDKIFVDLRSHIQTVHNKIRVHICNICSKPFGKKSGLDRHIITVHEKMRHWACDLCDKSFGEKSLLTRHRNIHFKATNHNNPDPTQITEDEEVITEEKKRMRCGVCKKILNSRSKLKRHKLLVHQKEKNLLCDFCPKLFGEKSNLMRHIFKSHAKESNLDNVKPAETKEERNDTTPSNKTENYSCLSCDKILITKWGLQAHEEGCRIKQQIKLNNQQDEAKEDEKEPPTFDKLEQVFLVSDDIKEEPLFMDENISNDLEVKCDPDESSLEDVVKQSIDLDVKEELDGLEMFPEVEIREDECGELFQNDSSNAGYTSDENSEEVVSNSLKDTEISSDQEVSNHLEMDHTENRADEDEKGRTCNICQPKKVFKRKRYFLLHVRAVHSEEKFTCEQCERSFSFRRSLVRHIKGVHQKSPDDVKPQFLCPICHRSFSFIRAMKRHVQAIHEDRRDFKCTNEGCEKSFRSRYELNEHFKKIHTGVKEKPISCTVCEKVFSSRKTLYSHRKKIHEGVRWNIKFQCRLCKEVFKTKYKKVKHWAQVHSYGKIQLRTCRLCDSEFQLFDEFKAHVESHVEHFICITCGEYFAEEASLLIHVESHRTIDKDLCLFVCDICSHRLSTKAQLIVHMRKHFSGDHYVCDVCGKAYKFIAPFIRHKKGHENRFDFPCHYCEKKFIISRDRMLHERSHTQERPYKCGECQKAFSQKVIYFNHLKTHDIKAGIKAHICKTCGSQFTSELKLRKHVDNDHPEDRPYRCCKCHKTFKASHAFETHRQKCGVVQERSSMRSNAKTETSFA